MNTNSCMYESSLRICIVQMYCIFIWDGSLQFNLSMMFDYTKAHSSKYCFSMFVVWWYYYRKLFSISNWKRSRILSANLTALMILLHLMHNSACSKIQLNSQIHNVRGGGQCNVCISLTSKYSLLSWPYRTRRAWYISTSLLSFTHNLSALCFVRTKW